MLHGLHMFLKSSCVQLDICWSHNDDWLLASCKDKSAYLWSLTSSNPLIHFSHEHRDLDPFEATFQEKRVNPQFTRDVMGAKFMMVDQIILLGVGNQIHIYKYAVNDVEEADDHLESLIKNRNRCELPKRTPSNTYLCIE